ncbi:hypothetical protein ACTFIY_000271 [Dictyostelium cf. discoideum]
MNKENFFDEDVYIYVKKNQTNRVFFYIKTLIILGVMVANELDFVYNSFQFTIIGCNNVSSIESYEDSYVNSIISTLDESKYTFETCIEYGIQKCIPELFITTSNTSLSFSIPIFLSNNSQLGKYFSGNIYFIYSVVLIFFGIMFSFFYEERKLYVLRSRAHDLLCMNILIKRQSKWKTLRTVAPAFLVVLLYSILKYVMINGFQKDLSIIECNQIPIALFFEGKSQSSLYGIIFNFLLFLFIFKDPIYEMYNNTSEYYEELTLTKFVESKNSANSLERMKLLKYCTLETINQAVTKFVGKNYQDGTISKYERKRRNNVFQYFKTATEDFIPAVLEYYQENPHLFSPIISNQIDLESIGKDNDDENEKLIN